MAMRTHLAVLDGAAPGQRLDVSLVSRRDGRLAVELRQQHYAEGIGWFDQRSLELDPRQLRQLQAVLGQASPRLAAQAEESRDVIPFPGPADQREQRPAASE